VKERERTLKEKGSVPNTTRSPAMSHINNVLSFDVEMAAANTRSLILDNGGLEARVAMASKLY